MSSKCSACSGKGRRLVDGIGVECDVCDGEGIYLEPVCTTCDEGIGGRCVDCRRTLIEADEERARLMGVMQMDDSPCQPTEYLQHNVDPATMVCTWCGKPCAEITHGPLVSCPGNPKATRVTGYYLRKNDGWYSESEGQVWWTSENHDSFQRDSLPYDKACALAVEHEADVIVFDGEASRLVFSGKQGASTIKGIDPHMAERMYRFWPYAQLPNVDEFHEAMGLCRDLLELLPGPSLARDIKSVAEYGHHLANQWMTGAHGRIHLERLALKMEELSELAEGMSEHDRRKIIDGLADLTYLCLGTAALYKIDLMEAVRRVHASNMTKDPGQPKPIKGKNFKAPDFEGL